MRIIDRLFPLVACLLLFFVQAHADWKPINPRIIGGTLNARCWPGMTSIGNGRIILYGGSAINNIGSNEVWFYDLNKKRWLLNSTSAIRWNFGMAYLGWESVLINGGDYNSGIHSDTTRYDHTADTMTNLVPGGSNGVPGYSGRIYSHRMCFIEQGKVLLYGGVSSNSQFDKTWLYNASSNEWQLMNPTINPVGENLTARWAYGMAYIGSGKAILFGGVDPSGSCNDTWIYDSSQNSWTKMSPEVSGGTLTSRNQTGMAYIGGDKVLLFGGLLAGGAVTNEIWIYDLSDNQWTNLTSTGSGITPTSRRAMGLAFAGLGKVLMFGGYTTSYLDDTWSFSIPNNVQDTISWEIRPGVLEISWSIPEDFSDVQFSIFRDGTEVSSSVIPGPAVNGIIPYTFLDPGLTPNKIYSYRIRETYPVMNSQIDYAEIRVPYCE